jgi:hypothetical protein
LAAQELQRLVPRFAVRRLLRNPFFTKPADIARLAEGLRKAGLSE